MISVQKRKAASVGRLVLKPAFAPARLSGDQSALDRRLGDNRPTGHSRQLGRLWTGSATLHWLGLDLHRRGSWPRRVRHRSDIDLDRVARDASLLAQSGGARKP